MNFEELDKLSQEKKEEMLKDLIKNDVTYWQKLLLLLNIEDDKYEKLLDTIIENKIREISLIDPKARYGSAFRQVLEVLKYIPANYYEKISPSFIEALNKNADMEYEFKIQPGLEFLELDLLQETKTILSMISDKFWKENDRQIKITEIFRNIGHYKVLAIGKNDNEYDFIYDWLDRNNITIRGIEGTISGEIPNFKHIPKMGQSYLPDEIDYERQVELFKRLEELKNGDDIKEYNKVRDELIVGNMRLAKWVANWKGINQLGIPEEDKDQMARLGLINAVDRFDYTKGYRFSTYACRVISGKIISEWYSQNPETPQMMEMIDSMETIEDEISKQLGREPTEKEIAEIMGISLKKVKEVQLFRIRSNTESVQELNDIHDDIGAISENIHDGDKVQEMDGDFIEDGVYLDEEYAIPLDVEGEREPSSEVMMSICKEQIAKILETLTSREREVLSWRFGFKDGSARSLDDVGARIGVSRERTRQIENKAIRKLRHRSKRKYIEDFYEDMAGR